MELIARNFECFPPTSSAYRELCPLLNQCEEVRFPYSIGESNSNQFTYDFDAHLKAKLLSCGASESKLAAESGGGVCTALAASLDPEETAAGAVLFRTRCSNSPIAHPARTPTD